MGRSSLLLFFLALVVTICSAQRQRPNDPDQNEMPTLGTGATLTVRVAMANNEPVGQNYEVILESVRRGPVSRFMTNQQGQVTFRAVIPGEYVVRVSGRNIKDAASGVIELNRYDFRSEFVHVELANPDGTSMATSKQGSVSVASLNIPDKARKERDRGNDAFAKGDSAKAKEHYLKAIDIYPNYASAYNNLGTVYMSSADKAHAREAWAKAVEIDPTLDSANVNLARLDFQERDYASAIVPLERALAGAPKNPELLLLISEAEFMTKAYDKALVYARKVYELKHDQYEMAHIVAGRALEAQNHPDRALLEYENLLKESPGAPEAAEAKKSVSRLQTVATTQ